MMASLAGLIARNLSSGAGSDLRPRRRSRFEPPVPDALAPAEGRMTAAFESRDPQADRNVAAPVVPHLTEPTRHELVPRDHTIPAPAPRPSHTATFDELRQRSPDGRPDDSSFRATRGATEPIRAVATIASFHPSSQELTDGSSSRSRRARTTDRPEQGIEPPDRLLSARQETVIEVTIGRVDVRTTTAAAAPPPPRQPARPSRVSLEDYLSQRTRGQR
jgi:hypothetical protein